MNYKNCANCNQSNPSDMRFCNNCGTELITANNDLPPTVFGGFSANPPSGQTPPQNFEQPNFGQPSFQTPPPNFQPPNFQPQQPVNFQQPNFQPSYQAAPASGGMAKKVLLGIGGILIGFIMLASGGVKLYRAFGGSNNNPAPYYSPTPQNLYSNTNSSRSATPDSSDLTSYTRQTVGRWSLRETIKGNPQTSGFTGATAENQLKYYDSSNNFLHVTMANFPSEAAAQSNLRSQFQKFKSLKLTTTPESGVNDNDGNEIGIMQTMTSANGKIHTIYWTRKNIVVRVLGARTDVENFFKAY